MFELHSSLQVSTPLIVNNGGTDVAGFMPAYALLQLICDHMDEGLEEGQPAEIGGMLCMIPGEGLSYVAGENTAEDPASSIQLSAEWVAGLVARAYVPVALVHSHPGGQEAPSPRDMELFPSWLVPQGIIVQPKSRFSSIVTIYDAHNWQRKPWSEVFLATPE